MNVVWVAQEHLMAHWCQAMAHFELGCVKKWHLDAKSGQKLTLVSMFDSRTVSVGLFHIIHKPLNLQ